MSREVGSQSGGSIHNFGRRTLSVMLTYQCTAECTDCGTLSSPKVKESIPLESAMNLIEQASDLGFSIVVFTGGEATLRWKELLTCITRTKELRLPNRLVTNAHWGTSRQTAKQKISDLMDAGLGEINFSTGDEHVRFIPLERVVYATSAALDAGLRTSVMVESRLNRSVTRDSFLASFKNSFPTQELDKLSIVESPWMPIDPARTTEYDSNLAVNENTAVLQNGCDSILTTYTVQGNGQIGACCGLGMRLVPELNIGTIESKLTTLVGEAEQDFVKILIRYVGPHRILKWAAEKDPAIAWENKYAHHCQACLRLYSDERVRKVILEHHSEFEDEILDTMMLQRKYINIFNPVQHTLQSIEKIVTEM